MNRKQFIAAGFAWLAVGSRVVNANVGKKFYITGLFHTDKLNDCTVPAIEAYGTNRTDALLNWVESSGVTVWTAEEYEDFRKRDGRDFDRGCSSVRKKDGAK